MSDDSRSSMESGAYLLSNDQEPTQAGPVAPKKAPAPASSTAVAPPPAAAKPPVPLATATAPVPGQLSQTSVNVPVIAEQTKQAQETMGPARAAETSNMLEDPNFQKGALGGAALLAALGLTGLAISKVVGKEGKTPSAPSGVEPTLETAPTGGAPTGGAPAETAPKTLSESVAQQKAAAANLTAQEQEMIAKSEQAKADKAQIAERKATKEKIAEVQAKAAAEAPEGMRPNYIKNAKNPIGPGGYNWLYGQEGERSPDTWRNLFGEKNVPYDEAMKRYREFELSGQEPGRGLGEVPRHAAGGTNVRPKYIPKYIQGSVAPGTLAPLAILAAGLGLSTSPEAQAAMQKAAGAVKDLGISPDIFAGKGEELGRLGTTYVTAGNPSYRAELLGQMKTEKDPVRYKQLMDEYMKAGGNVPGGRGVAPSYAYPR